MKLTSIILCSLPILLSACVANQQDVIILEERLVAVEYKARELEQKNAQLESQLNKDLDTIGQTRKTSERTLRTQVAGYSADMQIMQQEVRLLKGRLEEIEYLVNRKVAGYEASGTKNSERVDELGLSVSKMDQRLSRLEQYLNLEGKSGKVSAAAAGAAAGMAAGAKSGAKSDKALYDQAIQDYDNGELDKARQGFQALIKEYPKSQHADNAQFWIGESYYREKWYERAILEYQTVIEKYPKGNKVPAAMLKQGMALLQIGEKSSARLILQELVKKYPKAPEAKIATNKLKTF